MSTKTAKPEISWIDMGARAFGTITARRNGTVVQIKGGTLDGHLIACLNGNTYREICGDCDGTGYRPGYDFSDNGRCWPCNYSGLGKSIGTHSITELMKILERRAYGAAYRLRKAEEKATVAKAGHAEWYAANPEIHAVVDMARDINEFNDEHSPLLLELAWRAAIKELTEKQVALLVKLTAEHEDKLAKRTARDDVQVWIGEVGEKVTVTGTLAPIKHIESDWGTSTLYKLTTAEGCVVTWFRSGYHTEDSETITLTGRVKKLAESEKFGKETVLTRCRVS